LLLLEELEKSQRTELEEGQVTETPAPVLLEKEEDEQERSSETEEDGQEMTKPLRD